MSSNFSVLDVVIGVLINSEKQVLIAQRPAHASYAGLWEFPGGKVESKEENYEALCRELQEEIGIEIVNAKSIMTYIYHYPEYAVNFSVWLVKQYLHEPVGNEKQEVRWVRVTDLCHYTFPPANFRIIEYLQRRLLKNVL